MRSWTCFLVGTIAACLAAPSVAQEQPSGTEQAPIVIEGHRDRDSEIRELVDALPPARIGENIRRFEHSACPAVLGMPPAQKTLVLARIRAVAEAAGVPLGGPDCRANVLVMVTSDKRRLIEQLSVRYPYFFGDRSNRQVAWIARTPGPAALWHLNGQVDANGRELFSSMGYVPMNRTTAAGSRITVQAHGEFTGSLLVVEGGALDGLTTTQFADYAALRVFSGVDPARLTTPGLSTILRLLDAPMGSEVPVTLTNWDLAFLDSLYASDENIRAASQRSEIRDGMRRRIERTEGGEQP